MKTRLLAGLALVVGLAGPAAAEPATIFAAASTSRALDAALAAYSGDVVASYASSGTLARQIEQGAPVDLFLSANPRWMDHLVEAGLVRAEDVRPYLSNRLVLIAPAAAAALPLEAEAIAERLDGERLAVADPEHAPVGRYSQQSLQALGLWSVVEPALARTQDTNATVALVARGEAVLGLCYRTDALDVPGIQVLAELPADSHPPIVYPLAPVEGAPEVAGARDLLAFLQSAEARAILADYGFLVPGSGGS